MSCRRFNKRPLVAQQFFAFVLSGETLLKTPQSELILKSGDCFFAKKGSILTMNQTQEDFCELMIFVPDDFIKSVVHKYKIPLSQQPSDNKQDTVIPLAMD